MFSLIQDIIFFTESIDKVLVSLLIQILLQRLEEVLLIDSYLGPWNHLNTSGTVPSEKDYLLKMYDE